MKNNKKILVLFDFDGTLITHDSFFLLLKRIKIQYLNLIIFLLLHLPEIIKKSLKFDLHHAIKEKILYFITLHIKENHEEYFEKFTRELMESYGNNLMLEELNKHKKNPSAVLCIVSASPDLWIKKVAAYLGTDYICTICEYKNQRFTGSFVGKNCNRKEKAVRLSEKYNKEEFSCVIAYGNDLKNDATMFAWSDVVYLIRNNELYKIKNEKQEKSTNM